MQVETVRARERRRVRGRNQSVCELEQDFPDIWWCCGIVRLQFNVFSE